MPCASVSANLTRTTCENQPFMCGEIYLATYHLARVNG